MKESESESGREGGFNGSREPSNMRQGCSSGSAEVKMEKERN